MMNFTFQTTQRGARISNRLKQSNKRKAMERIAAGLPVGGPGSYAALTITQRACEETIAEQRRQADPVEQALTKLRRNRMVIYRASVVGGRRDMFVINRKSGDTLITEAQVMELAARV